MSIRTTLTIGFYLLVLWYILFVAGTIQYRLLRKKTIEIVLKYAQRAIDGNLLKSYESVYEALYPEWCEMVKKTALFIPDKTELRPILANEKNVKGRLIFSPRWVKDCLKDHKIEFDENQ
jgi:hypothetical protein